MVSELNTGCPQATHLKVPSDFSSLSSLVNGASVPFSLTILYCSGLSSAFHSASVFLTFSTLASVLGGE